MTTEVTVINHGPKPIEIHLDGIANLVQPLMTYKFHIWQDRQVNIMEVEDGNQNNS